MPASSADHAVRRSGLSQPIRARSGDSRTMPFGEYSMTGTYQFAEKTVRIDSIYEGIHAYCRDYAVPGPSGGEDIAVTISQADLDHERSRAGGSWSDGYLELLAVYRRIAEKMPAYDTVLMHGSAVAVDGCAYLFIAPSGTGKSTHARLWREAFGERAVMVNDDKPLVKITSSAATVFGTPWNGKHRLGSNISAPLKAVCILERAQTNRIRKIDPYEAYPVLLQQTYRPADPLMLKKTLSLIDRLSETAGLYRLGCNMEREAALVSYDGMRD